MRRPEVQPLLSCQSLCFLRPERKKIVNSFLHKIKKIFFNAGWVFCSLEEDVKNGARSHVIRWKEKNALQMA